MEILGSLDTFSEEKKVQSLRQLTFIFTVKPGLLTGMGTANNAVCQFPLSPLVVVCKSNLFLFVCWTTSQTLNITINLI